MEPSTIISSIPFPFWGMGGGGLLGFIVGIAIKKIVIILSVIAGLGFGALMYLSHIGLVKVDWLKAEAMMKTAIYSTSNTLSQMINEVSTQLHQNSTTETLGLGFVGFTGGFLYGVRR